MKRGHILKVGLLGTSNLGLFVFLVVLVLNFGLYLNRLNVNFAQYYFFLNYAINRRLFFLATAYKYLRTDLGDRPVI